MRSTRYRQLAALALLAPCICAQQASPALRGVQYLTADHRLQTPLQPRSSKSADGSIDIWHRVIPYASGATETDPAWTRRGKIHVQEGQATWQQDSDAFANLASEGDLYQIGFASIHSPLDTSPSITSFVSVPETSEPLQDTITLNVKSNEEFSKPTHLAYYVAGAQLTGCQPGERSSNFETAVDLRYPDVIDPPRLHKPVVVNYQPDGTVKEPEPEKSFIQKYWMYMVPVLLLLMTSGGGGEEGAPAPARR